MPRMRNLWICPHLGETTACLESLAGQGFTVRVLETNSKWTCAQLDLEIWRVGAGQFSLTKRMPELLAVPATRVFLLGVAGALDPGLSLTQVIEQNESISQFYLSSKVIDSVAERDSLYQQTRMPAVVMESFWSDPQLRTQLLKEDKKQFHEIRGISDHCENLNLTALQKRLPAIMDQVARQALSQIQNLE